MNPLFIGFPSRYAAPDSGFAAIIFRSPELHRCLFTRCPPNFPRAAVSAPSRAPAFPPVTVGFPFFSNRNL